MTLEPPRIPNLGALGVLCHKCYPGAGDPTTLCDRHFRQELHITEHGAAAVEFSHVATVETIVEHCVPARYRDVQLTQETGATLNLNPLHTGILLHGKAGRGKTYQAGILFRRAVRYATERGPALASSFQWHSAAGLFERIRNEQRRTTEIRSTVEKLVDARLLVIDDLGAERPTEWVRERLYEIVNARYEAVRPMIVTTNLAPPQLEKQLGARITGRLMEICEVVHLEGANRRAPEGAVA
jgi:DNA replication protein DnaC